jgi:hypothetical protein
MNKKSYNRMVKKVHEINSGPLSFPIIIKKLMPLDQQTNYNSMLREWVGPQEYEIVAYTTGIFEAFKQSEEWRENGTLSMHDWKCAINDTIAVDTNCIVERTDTSEVFEVVFKREYIGEFIIGLRPVKE